MTGAPVPNDCNWVIMQEQCEVKENNQVIFQGNILKQDNIIKKGEDCLAGTNILEEGTVLHTEQLTVLAGLGIAKVKVVKPPRVLLITTGKEVIAPGDMLAEGKIYNSNLMMLQTFLQELGITPIECIHLSDDPYLIEQEFTKLKKCIETQEIDVVISTGGVSVGDFDYMPTLYKRLGAEVLYERIQMRPGAASFGGVNKRTLFFGLSGNPMAAYNAYYLLVLPVLKTLLGDKTQLVITTANLQSDIKKFCPFDRYVSGYCFLEQGRVQFSPNFHFSSSTLLGLLNSNALAILLKGSKETLANSEVKVILLNKQIGIK